MRRRTLLGSVTGALTALAGCNGFGGGVAETQTRRPFSVATTTTATTGEPGVLDSSRPDRLRPRAVSELGETAIQFAVADVGTAEDHLALRVGFAADATPEHPARLWVEVANRGPIPAEFRFDGSAPVGDLVGSYEARTNGPTATASGIASGPPRLLLLPADGDRFETDWAADNETCWRVADEFSPPADEEHVELYPGERVGRAYDLVSPATGDCLVPGVYRFREDRYGGTFTVSVWKPDPPPESRFRGTAVPDLPACATHWFHEGEREVYLEPTSEAVETPVTLRVTLHDLSDQRVVPTAVQVFRLVDGEWVALLPPSREPRPTALFPGQTARRTLRLGVEPAFVDSRETLPGLRSGRYAVLFGAYRDVETTRCVTAMVQVTGDPVSLTPSDFVTRTSRDGGVLSVEAGPTSSAPQPDEDRATIAVGRAPAAAPETTFLLEQVFQRQALRDTLAFLHADQRLSRVRLTTTTGAVAEVLGPASAPDTGSGEHTRRGPVTFTFDGATYRAQVPADK
ncbi:hypothetical protein [Haloarchaeobius amylolyticus]|uniref:hypothetical protein n=1 Tax=Haloarchaeobius amylolyticus TaxID=1198296 RepID=UPI002271EA77|nr:hypothetical protein [Haloarchaeobius amylolyticus]